MTIQSEILMYNYLYQKRNKLGQFLSRYNKVNFNYPSSENGVLKYRIVWEILKSNKKYIIGKELSDNFKIKTFLRSKMVNPIWYN